MSAPLQPTDATSQLAQHLSRVWTPAEREAWRILEQGILGFTFRRHAVLDGLLVGFYCPELGVIIQLDDGQGGGNPQTETRTLDGVRLTIALVPSEKVTRTTIVEAIERAVKPGTLWPED